MAAETVRATDEPFHPTTPKIVFTKNDPPLLSLLLSSLTDLLSLSHIHSIFLSRSRSPLPFSFSFHSQLNDRPQAQEELSIVDFAEEGRVLLLLLLLLLVLLLLVLLLLLLLLLVLLLVLLRKTRLTRQIGRASCRERC